MGYKAPLNIRFADTGSIGALLGRFRPVSSMRKHLGRRYSVEALYDLDYHDDSDLEKIRLVRAFVVEPLINSTIRIESQSDIGPALKNLLESKLPGIQWQVKDDWSEPFRKYFIIHGSIPAPLKSATYSNVMYPGVGVPLYG